MMPRALRCAGGYRGWNRNCERPSKHPSPRHGCRHLSEVAMNDGDVLLRQENPWLLGYGALIRMSPLLMSPLLWPFWWPLMCAGQITAGEITADRPENLHAMRLALCS